MKKKLLFLAFVILSFAGFSQSYLAESFEGTFPPTGWTIINNGSGNDWNQSSSYSSDGLYSMQYKYSLSESADAWAVSPAMNLNGGDTVKITFDYRVYSSDYPEKLKITIGQTTTVAGQTTVLSIDSNLVNTVFATKTIQFIVPDSGDWFLGFNCFSETNMYYLYIDNIKVFIPSPVDVNINSLLSPIKRCGITDSASVTVRMINEGSEEVLNFPVSLNTGSQIIIDTVAFLGIGDTLDHTFSNSIDMSNTDPVNLLIYSSAAGDLNPINDTVKYSLPGVPIEVNQNFEGTLPPGWMSEIYITGNHGTDGSKGLTGNLWSSNKVDTLITTFYAPSGPDIKLKFDYRVVNFSGYPSTATVIGGNKFSIYYSTDCGTNFVLLDVIDSSNHIESINFATKKYDFTAFSGQHIIIKFVLTHESGDYYFDLDNFYFSNAIALDIASASVDIPIANICSNPSVPVSMFVFNSGPAIIDFSINSATLSVNVTGASTGTIGPAVLDSGILGIGDTLQVQVGSFVFSGPGNYNFKGSIKLTGDQAPSNDSAMVSKTITDTSYPLDYLANFNAAIPANWSGDFYYSTTHGKSGTGGYTDNLYSSSSLSTFTTAKIGPLGTNSKLVFDYRIVEYLNYPDLQTNLSDSTKIEILISTDCGISYSLFKEINSTNHIATTDFKNQIYNLSSFAGSVVSFKFRVIWAAGDFYVDIDNFEVINSLPVDFAVLQVKGLAASVCPLSGVPVFVKFFNNGSTAIDFSTTNASAAVTVNGPDSGNIGPFVINSGILNPGDTMEVEVGTYNFVTPGKYIVTGVLSLAGDSISSNDSAAFYSKVNALYPVDYYSGFESGLSSDWDAQFLVLGNHGVAGSMGLAGELTGAYTYSEFITSQFGPLSANASLLFDYRLVESNGYPATAYSIEDSTLVEIWISDNCGSSFSLLDKIQKSNHITSTQFINRKTSLNAFAGSEVIFKFKAQYESTSFFFDIDNFKIENAVDTDLAAIQIEGIGTTGCSTQDFPVSVVVFNNGLNPIDFSVSPANLSAIISGASNGTVGPFLLNSGVLAVGDSLTVEIGTYDFLNSGTYNISCIAKIQGDMKSKNDTSGITNMKIDPTFGLPYFTDFANLPAGWSGDFSIMANHGVGSSPGYAAEVYFSTEQFISSSIGPVDSSTALIFDYRLVQWSGYPSTAYSITDLTRIEILISTDCGNSYSLFQTIGQAEHVTSNAFKNKMYSLSDYTGTNVKFKFQAIGVSGDFYVDIDNFEVRNVSSIDMMAVKLNLNESSLCLGPSEPLIITIKNNGITPHNFVSSPLTITTGITGPNPAMIDLVIVNSGTLAAGATKVVTIANYDFSAEGFYDLVVSVNVAGDGDLTNDTLKTKLANFFAPEVNFNGFTGANLDQVFPGWHQGNGANPLTSNVTDWEQGINLGGSGNVTAKINYFLEDGKNWIYSSEFVPTVSTMVHFSVAVVEVGTISVAEVMGTDDKFSLMASTNCGVSWSTVKALTKADSIPKTLKEFVVSMAAYSGQSVMLGFLADENAFGDENDYDIHLDNIMVVDTSEITANPSVYLNSGTLMVYPNPTNGMVNIVFGMEGNKQVKVSGIDGKLVMKENFIGANKIFDLSGLNKGVYFMEVTGGAGREYRKIIVH